MRKREQLQRLVLVPVRPFRRITWSLGVVLLLALAGFAGYLLGQRQVPAPDAGPDERRREQAVTEMADVRLKECDIVAQASRALQEDHRELLASLAAIEDRLLFYRRMAAPGAASVPAGIEQLELLPGRQPGSVHYRLLVARDARGAQSVPAVILLSAGAGGRQQTLRLTAPRFQFRYYLQYSGDWQLPAGFRPERLDVQLQQDGRPVTRRYKWEIKT